MKSDNTGNTPPEPIIELLPVKLSEGELLEMAHESAKAHVSSVTIEGEAKAAADDFKAQIGKNKARVSYLSGCINTGQQMREVECNWELNYTDHTASLIRTDTNEVVRTRPLRAQEYQKELDLHLFKRGTEGETLTPLENQMIDGLVKDTHRKK